MRAIRFAAVMMLGALVAQTAPALGQPAAESARLAACIAKIETDAEGAYEDGLAWSSEGNRPAARHCTALALIALGQEEAAAGRLEMLANAPDAGGLEARAVYLAQAGNAWLLADAPEAAVVALTSALKLRPSDAELHKDRARAHITMKTWDKAGQDLDAAIRLSPGDAETHHMRARVLLETGRLDEAWKDVLAAMRQAPQDVSILVTRGDVREAMRLKGLPDPEGVE